MIQLCAGSVACINHLTQRLMKWGWFGLDFFLGGLGGGFGAGAFCNELFFMLSLLNKIMKISNNFF